MSVHWSEATYFKAGEFVCRHCGEEHMNEFFIADLERLRELMGIPLHIMSGYRCPEHNALVSRTGNNGPHTTGMAADIRINGEDAFRLIEKAITIGITGIGVAQKGDHRTRYIHLDTVGGTMRPRVWSY